MRWGGIFDVDGLERQLDHLNAKASSEGFWNDPEAAQALVQERAGIEGTVTRLRGLEREAKDLGELLEMAASEGEESMIEDVVSQIPDLEARVRSAELARMLNRPDDKNDAILYINAGAGGADAQDWAELLFRMYLRWCERKGYRTEVLDEQPGGQAGISGATIAVRGPNAYGYLKAENGVHRLIRISPFGSGTRETSFAAVAVVPEIDDDVEVDIRKEDLEVDTMRAGGKGGQHVNKTESAIRIKHVPSGIVVKCSAERSQHKNRSTAMKMLKGLLYQRMLEEKAKEFSDSYESGKSAIDFGSQIRTYTMQPYQLVKDERTEHKSSNINGVLDGDLDEFIEAYLLFSADTRAAAGKKN